MKVITATMANNIAHDFEKNEFKPHIDKAMDRILRAAQKGDCSVQILKDGPFKQSAYENLYVFWGGLGYKVINFPSAYELHW